MSKSGNFVKQAAILAFAGLFVRLIGFLYRLPLTSMIGNQGNGIYAAGFYLYTFFLILSSAGLPAAISKMVSARLALKQYENAHRVFRVSLIVSGSLGLIGSLFMFFGAEWFTYFISSPRSYYSIIALSPTVFIVAIMSVFRGYFQGMNNTVPTAVSQIIEQIFNAVFSVFLCYMFMLGSQDVARGAAGGTSGTGIGALAGLICLIFIYFKFKPKIIKKIKENPGSFKEENKVIIKDLFFTAIPIITGTAILSMTNLIDMKMVNARLLASGYSANEVEGLYGLLTGKYGTLTTLPISISTAMATAALPTIAYSIAKGDKATANNKINTTIRITMLISIPAAIGIGVLSDQILLMLFPKYPDGGYLLRYGMFSIIILSFTQILTGMLQGSGYVKIPAIAALCGAVVKIPLTYFLVPIKSINIFGIEIPLNVGGAVISTICCYLVAAIIDVIVLKRIMGKGNKLKLGEAVMKPAIAAVVMGITCFWLYKLLFMLIPNNAFACILSIFIGVIVYFGFLYVLKGVTKEDLAMVRFK